jgi:sugar transferase (PEP-CTERM/EpsH1 system associated)
VEASCGAHVAPGYIAKTLRYHGGSAAFLASASQSDEPCMSAIKMDEDFMRVLFVTMRLPFPPLKGDQAVPYYRIKYLSKRHEITLLSFVESPAEFDYISQLSPYCVRIETVVLPKWRSYWNVATMAYRRLPLQVLYYRSHLFRRKLNALVEQGRFDLIHSVLLRGAPYTMGLLNAVKILDMIDALSLNMERRAEIEHSIKRWVFRHEAARVRRFEQRICERFDRVIVVSEIDKQHLGARNVSVIPLGVEIPEVGKQVVGGTPTAIFTGNMGYFPNREAAFFLAREVFPVLRKEIPGLRLRIVGADPPAALRSLAKRDSGLEVLGFVPDLGRHLRESSVALSPLRTGSGMQFKVLEAMAQGIPVVASPLAVEGIAARDREHLLVASGVDDIARAVRKILAEPTLAALLAANGKELVAARYTWEATTRQLEELHSQTLEERASSASHAHRH